MLESERASGLWPHDYTDVAVLPDQLDPADRDICAAARRAKRYCGAPIYRDPRLTPHEPKRAQARRPI